LGLRPLAELGAGRRDLLEALATMREAARIERIVVRRLAAILRIDTSNWPTSSVERVSPISMAKFWAARLLAESTARVMGAVMLRTMTDTRPAATSRATATSPMLHRL
jgi:hypothetical protein